MGFNTTINVLNDALHLVRDNPEEFVDGLMENYNDGGTYGVGNHVNCVTVMRSGHADEFRLYAVHGNSIIELSPYASDTMRLANRFPAIVKAAISAARFYLDRLEKSIDS